LKEYMSAAPRQQKLPQPLTSGRESICVNRKIFDRAINEHRLSGSERQILLNAWDHDQNWKEGHTYWFRSSDAVNAVIEKVEAMGEME
jgi:hypothetical protein